MVGIFIDDDVVAVPEPVAAEADVIGSDAEIEATEPEAVGTAPREMPDVAASEAAGKASVFPGMIEVVMGIVAAGVMADPFAIGMNVRRVRMSGLVVEVTGCWGRMPSWRWSGAVRRDVPDATADGSAMLGKGYERKQQADCEQADKFFHNCSFSGFAPTTGKDFTVRRVAGANCASNCKRG